MRNRLLVLFVHVVRTVRNKSLGAVMKTAKSKRIRSGDQIAVLGGFALSLEIVVVTLVEA